MPHILISRSKDGETVARASHFLGLKTVRGSAKRGRVQKKGNLHGKGGAAAFREMLAVVAGNHCVVITPDGPKGPRQRLGEGPLSLARHSGAPLVSCMFAVKNRKTIPSWDRFIVPLPFGKGSIIWGTPVTLASDISDAEMEALRQKLELEMNENLARADQQCGHDPCLPEADLNTSTRRPKLNT